MCRGLFENKAEGFSGELCREVLVCMCSGFTVAHIQVCLLATHIPQVIPNARATSAQGGLSDSPASAVLCPQLCLASTGNFPTPLWCPWALTASQQCTEQVDRRPQASGQEAAQAVALAEAVGMGLGAVAAAADAASLPPKLASLHRWKWSLPAAASTRAVAEHLACGPNPAAATLPQNSNFPRSRLASPYFPALTAATPSSRCAVCMDWVHGAGWCWSHMAGSSSGHPSG